MALQFSGEALPAGVPPGQAQRAARGETPTALDRRCIPAACVASRSHTVFPLVAPCRPGSAADSVRHGAFTSDCSYPGIGHPVASPAALCHTGDIALERQPPETQPTQLELAQEPTRPAAQPAPVAKPYFELRRLLFLDDFRGCSHRCPLERPQDAPLSERGARTSSPWQRSRCIRRARRTGKSVQSCAGHDTSWFGTASPATGATVALPRRSWPS